MPSSIPETVSAGKAIQLDHYHKQSIFEEPINMTTLNKDESERNWMHTINTVLVKKLGSMKFDDAPLFQHLEPTKEDVVSSAMHSAVLIQGCAPTGKLSTLASCFVERKVEHCLRSANVLDILTLNILTGLRSSSMIMRGLLGRVLSTAQCLPSPGWC